ncbi:MAG: hypothetical protein H6556_02885 [Lewinellaceae bacterium]|nr:hypothetical protein [Lewinellaceae bacterium]
MRYLSFLFLIFCFCFSASLSAQSEAVGEWKTMIPGQEEGSMIPLHVSIKDDNTYALDFGADGAVEIKGSYQSKGDQIVIQDVEGSDCTGKGIYTFEVNDAGMTMTRVSDECEGRGGPEGKMVFDRK